MPGLSKLDNALRWGFIKKVYGILSAQLLLSACVAAGARRARARRRLSTARSFSAVPLLLLCVILRVADGVCALAPVIMFNAPVQRFVMGSLAFQLTFAILPLVGARPPPLCRLPSLLGLARTELNSRAGAGLIPLFIYSRRHPHNLIILGLWVRRQPWCTAWRRAAASPASALHAGQPAGAPRARKSAWRALVPAPSRPRLRGAGVGGCC